MIFKVEFQYLLVGCLSVVCICKEMKERTFTRRAECGFDEGSVFQGSVIQAYTGISMSRCGIWCTENADCKSFNYEERTGRCQLSNTTAPTCGTLTALAGHNYFEKEVSVFALKYQFSVIMLA